MNGEDRNYSVTPQFTQTEKAALKKAHLMRGEPIQEIVRNATLKELRARGLLEILPEPEEFR